MSDKVLRQIILSVGEFRNLYPNIAANLMLTVLHVALAPGLSISDIGIRMGVSTSAASRNVTALSARVIERRQQGPLGLIELRLSPQDSRRTELHLSRKGQVVISRVLAHSA